MKVSGQTERTLTPDNTRDKKAKYKHRELTVATYNVRTLNGSGKEHRLLSGCELFNISIVAIQEHRQFYEAGFNQEWTEDRKWLKIFSSATKAINGSTIGGVGLILEKRLANALKSCNQISDRIITADIEANPQISIIAAYGPTNCKHSDEKDLFESDLKRALEAIAPHNIIIMLGDFNAQIGKDYNEVLPHIVGRFAYHQETNDNGERLVDLCQSHNMRPANSRYNHRKNRLWTFELPNQELQETCKQLDHILINSKWVNSFRNCRAYSTVDLGSDHRILSANIKISLRIKKRSPNPRTKFNTDRLKHKEMQQKFEIELQNRFEVFQEADSNNNEIQNWYDNLEESVEATCKTILGTTMHSKLPNWVSERTTNLYLDLEKARKKYRQRKSKLLRKKWREAEEKLCKSYKEDEEARLEKELAELERSSKCNNIKRTWQLVNKLSGKGDKKVAKVKLLNGKEPATQEELLTDWSKYFESLLNGKIAATTNLPVPAVKDLPICTESFSYYEIEDAIEHLHDNRSPGTDSALTAEVLKRGGKYIRRQTHHICNQVYEQHIAPKQWTTNLIVPVPKKGNLQLMTNYRGISLMSIVAKVYNKVILNRLQPVVDKILRPNQAGFRLGRGCIQQIHILRRIFEGAAAKQLPLYATFIDFKKAFDSINRSVMFSILRNYGIPEKIVQAIRTIYEQSTSRVLVDGKISKEFKTNTGVLQGDVLAPFLFIIVIDYVMRKSEDSFGFITHLQEGTRTRIKKPEQRLNDLDYADDIALLESTLERSQNQLERTNEEANKVGLEINVDKTKLMIIGAPLFGPYQTISLNGDYIEVVRDFKYLGSMMASTAGDIRVRKGQAWAAFWKLKDIWKAKNVSIQLKIRLFKATVLSILLYGSETWITNQQQKNMLDSFATSCYRVMLNVKRTDRLSNAEIYNRVAQKPLSVTLAKRQLSWVGHILRREKSEPIRNLALYRPTHGDNKPGRPALTYYKHIADLINNEFEWSEQEIERVANDRKKWKLVLDCIDAIT